MNWYRVTMTIQAEDEQDAVSKVMSAMQGQHHGTLMIDHFIVDDGHEARDLGGSWKRDAREFLHDLATEPFLATPNTTERAQELLRRMP